MKRLCRTTVTFLLYAGILTECGSKEDTKTEKKVLVVSVAQVVEHELLNTIRGSFEAEVEALGYRDGENTKLDFRDVDGQWDMLNSIISTFAGNKSDIIVTIAIPTTMAAAKYNKSVPIIFSAVNDPVGADLMDDLKKPNNNITGTSDEIQVDQILDLALKVDPDLETLGFVYNSSEASSVSNLAKAKKFCKKHDAKLVEGSGANITETQSAVSMFTDKYDTTFAPNDNMAASPMSVLVETADKKKVSVYTGADLMVSGSSFMMVGIDYIELGKEAARMTDKTLKDEDVENLPVKAFKDNLNVYVNEKTIETLSIQLPKDVENNRNLVIM